MNANLPPVDANPDNFWFSGRRPNADEWNAFLIRFHQQYPRATSDVFCQLVDERGRTSYDVLAEDVASAVAEGAKLLELGCGEGELLARIRERRSDIELHAVDLVESAVAYASSLVSGANIVVGDATRLPWNDGSFEALVSHMMLPYAYESEGVLREAARVLVPSGCFAFVIPDWLAPSTFVAVFGAAVAHVRDVHAGFGSAFEVDQRLINEGRTRELFVAAGLRIESERRVIVGAPGNRGLLADFIRRAYPFGLLDDVTLAEVIEAVEAQAPARLELVLRVVSGVRA